MTLPFLDAILEMSLEYWINWNHKTQSDEWLDSDEFNENNNVYVSQIDEFLTLPPPSWSGEDVFQDAISDVSLVVGSFVNGTFIPEYERIQSLEKTPGCREFIIDSRLNTDY